MKDCSRRIKGEMEMTERYCLNESVLPTIPVPHDCVITGIEEEDEFLIFRFEDNLSYHDSIQAIHPSAKGLTIRFRKLKSSFAENMEMYRYKSSGHQSGYMQKKPKKLFKLARRGKRPLEYLEHFLAPYTMVIHLFSRNSIVLRIFTDVVEFEWME